MAKEKRILNVSGNQGRAIDQAIDMLSIALRSEYEDARSRRADLLRERLKSAERPALRERVRSAIER